MDSRLQQYLDDYSADHWDEDQIKEEKEEKEKYSAHQEYCDNRNLEGVYSYCPAADGPEVEVIRAILTHFPELNPSFPGRLRK
jgi:hypothetical protein